MKGNGTKTNSGGTRVATAKVEKEQPVKAEPVAKETPKPSGSGGSGDESFDELFGDEKKKPAKEEKKTVDDKKKPAVYVPPPPGSGGGELKDALESSDIMETVVANKSGLQRCAEEQKKREGGSSGKIVMKWTIETSGSVKNVSVVTEELKGSYMASCMSSLIKGMKFPRHKKQGEPVQCPFKF